MVTFLSLLLIPIIWVFVVKVVLRKTISGVEVIVMITVTAMLIAVVYWAGAYSQTTDYQVLNGRVVEKEMNRVHCRHSYSCNCRTSCSGSGKSRSCSTVCDTCYEHSFDQDWDVNTTIGSWTIDTIDRQGLREPPRWTSVKLNDPVSKLDRYTNYVKAVPDSLFHFNPALIAKYKEGIPPYPLQIYDYYNINRFISMGVPVPDVAQWNRDISTMLGYIGAAKEVNAVVVVTKQSDYAYANALQAGWINGKKNDVILIIGAPEYPKIEWVRVLSWSKTDLVNVQLRDAVLEIGTVDREKIVPAMQSYITNAYQRRPMSDFEYLKDQIEPPEWVIWLSIVLSIASLIGMSIYFHKNDLVDVLNGRPRYYNGRYRY